MDNEDFNDFVPSILNPRTFRKDNAFSLTQNSIASHRSLSLRRATLPSPNGIIPNKKVLLEKKYNINEKENSLNICNFTQEVVQNKELAKLTNKILNKNKEDNGLSIFDDSIDNNFDSSSFKSGKEIEISEKLSSNEKNESHVSVCSSTEVNEEVLTSQDERNIIIDEVPLVTVQIGINNCDKVNLSTKHGILKNVSLTRQGNITTLDCKIKEHSEANSESDYEKNMDDNFANNTLKRAAVSVNLEIKKKKVSTEDTGDISKILILNTDALEKLSHVIVQPPNYKIVRQKLSDSKFKKRGERKSLIGIESKNANGKDCSGKLKQLSLDKFLSKTKRAKVNQRSSDPSWKGNCDDVSPIIHNAREMSRLVATADSSKADYSTRLFKNKKDLSSPVSARIHGKHEEHTKRQELKSSHSDAPRVPSSRKDSLSSNSPRRNIDTVHFPLPKVKSNKAVEPKTIPHYKIVAGTHFAVDAFSYGDIPNVKHYFLTHFHSDHYSGLKKCFNKVLYCSKITADLCVTRLGVNPKCIHIINQDESIKVDGVEVTPLDANHCPGAFMLLFTLPNGKTMLHTGDFRACPEMESYPVFWNRDVHTVYLDTTYCNPRYDFPTQDESLEMAMYILRQKKMALEKIGKKFSSVLIVCGTYTIGKEKFFLAMSRRVGCTVWACPEKDKVLHIVEGRSSSRAPPASCQLHVVAMRDLTPEKLRSYLDSMQGAFSEVVAFKPSGWENGKNSTIERDCVTIHGIPYSEHSSFSEMIRFVKYLKPRQVVPTVDISGGIKAVQKYFPCPLVYKDDIHPQTKVTEYFSIQQRAQVPAVT